MDQVSYFLFSCYHYNVHKATCMYIFTTTARVVVTRMHNWYFYFLETLLMSIHLSRTTLKINVYEALFNPI